ncbi:MAG: phage baseplate assembly protein V [Spirochaetales bacterium]|nr:phage baseplate assembly protein V [Spirochaetales bacterium]
MQGYVTSLKDILDEFSRDYYDPRAPLAREQYEENKRKQHFGFGIVVDNQDPDGLGRIKVSLPMTAKDYVSRWIWVCHSYAGNGAGVAVLPDINDQVLCAFINGNIHHPVCLGSMYTPRHRPPIADNADNNIKAIKTKSTYLVMDDTPGEERMEASIKDGQIRIVMDTQGIHLTNELGPIKMKCRKMTIKGAGGTRWVTQADTTINVGGNLNINTNSEAALTCGGNVTLQASTVNLKGSTGVTAEGKQMAKENDPVAGLDMHYVMVPYVGRVPLPHPYIGKLIDELSSDVNIDGKPAAYLGTISEFTTPGHFPLGTCFKPDPDKPQPPDWPDNMGEVTNGCIDSVKINGIAAAVLTSTVTTCDCLGITDQCAVMAPGTTFTFPITYPGQDPEQYRRDGGLPINLSNPAVYTPEEVAYAEEPKSLTNLQWSETQVEKGTEVILSCTTSGVKEDASVMFSIYPEGANPETDPPVMDIRGHNKDGRAEVKWMPRDIRKKGSALPPMKWFFTAWTLYCPKETSGICEVIQALELNLVDRAGEPIPDTPYKLIYPDGSDVSGTTDGDGKIQEENLIPGTYRIVIDPS